MQDTETLHRNIRFYCVQNESQKGTLPPRVKTMKATSDLPDNGQLTIIIPLGTMLSTTIPGTQYLAGELH